MESKECTSCHVEYPATSEYFHRNKNKRDGLEYRCKKCRSVQWKDYIEKARDKKRERGRAYYQENREKRILKSKNTRDAFKKKFGFCYVTLHKWVKDNKTKIGKCVMCGKEGKTDWANISGEYKRDLDDYQELCQSCHSIYDRQKEKDKNE